MGLEEEAVKEKVEDGRFEEGDDCPVCVLLGNIMRQLISAVSRPWRHQTSLYTTPVRAVAASVRTCTSPLTTAIHQGCFTMWAARAARNGGVTCVYCRHPWADTSKSKGKETVGADGYLNLASVAGISTHRDTS